MRRWGPLLLALACAAAQSRAAHAGVLASASLTIDTWGVSAIFPGVGATGTAASSTSATLAGGSAFAGVATFPTGTFGGMPLGDVGLQVYGNAAGSFDGATPGQVGGSALFTGSAQFYASPNAVTPFLVVPLSPGEADTIVKVNGFHLTFFWSSWTAGAATLTGVGSYKAPMTLMVTGMNALNPTGAGVLTLVSAAKVATSLGVTFPVVSTLTLTYVPEPATALLFGAGTLALALLGRGHDAKGEGRCRDDR